MDFNQGKENPFMASVAGGGSNPRAGLLGGMAQPPGMVGTGGGAQMPWAPKAPGAPDTGFGMPGGGFEQNQTTMPTPGAPPATPGVFTTPGMPTGAQPAVMPYDPSGGMVSGGLDPNLMGPPPVAGGGVGMPGGGFEQNTTTMPMPGAPPPTAGGAMPGLQPPNPAPPQPWLQDHSVEGTDAFFQANPAYSGAPVAYPGTENMPQANKATAGMPGMAGGATGGPADYWTQQRMQAAGPQPNLGLLNGAGKNNGNGIAKAPGQVAGQQPGGLSDMLMAGHA
jgi:hypothetical protein